MTRRRQPACARTDYVMRARVSIALSNVDEWGVRPAAEYMRHHHVPLPVALRVLAGRLAA